MKKLSLLALALAAVTTLVSACGKTADTGDSASGATDKGKTVEIHFFQYKPEARGTFDKLIKKFEETNPNIKIIQDNPPDPLTVLKTKVASNEVPDIIATGAGKEFAQFSKGGILTDLTAAPELATINESYINTLKGLSESDKVYGFPYAIIGNGVIYNKTLFQELNLQVPKTWDEFIAVCDKIKAAGKTPFFYGFKDAWTTLPFFNSIAASIQEDGFFDKRKDGTATFASGYTEITEKYLKLIEYGQKDLFGKGYNDGNVAFAKGESVMYLQGMWAISEALKANPDAKLGVFTLPGTNDPARNKLCAGVDLLLSVSAKTAHPEEAMTFVRFLLEKDSVKTYITDQNSFSAIKGVTQDNEAIAELNPAIEADQVAEFPDMHIPSSMKLDQLIQGLILNKDVPEFLSTMDKEWDKAQSR